MKAVFVHEDWECTLDVKGDDYRQGDKLQCAVTVKNRSMRNRKPPPFKISYGTILQKAVKARDYSVFEAIESCECEVVSTAPGGVQSWGYACEPWDGSPITDNKVTPAIALNLGDFRHVALLNVRPHRLIEEFFSVFESSFQFVKKSITNGHANGFDRVNAKMKPPSSTTYGQLDQLTVGMRFERNNLFVDYDFVIKLFDTTSEPVKVKKAATSMVQMVTRSEIELAPGKINVEAVERRINGAFESLRRFVS